MTGNKRCSVQRLLEAREEDQINEMVHGDQDDEDDDDDDDNDKILNVSFASTTTKGGGSKGRLLGGCWDSEGSWELRY